MSLSLRRATAALAGFIVISAGVAARAADSTTPHPSASGVLVPKGTTIVVQTIDPISSDTAYVGQVLEFTVSNDVIMNGRLIAKAGDRALGRVEDSVTGRKAHVGTLGALAGPGGAVAGAAVNKRRTKGSDLRISVNSVTTYCGGTIPLAFIRSEYHRPKRMQKMTPVHVASGQMYRTTVAADAHTCSQATAAVPGPVPANALPPDPS